VCGDLPVKDLRRLRRITPGGTGISESLYNRVATPSIETASVVVMIPGDEPEDIVHPCGKDLT